MGLRSGLLSPPKGQRGWERTPTAERRLVIADFNFPLGRGLCLWFPPDGPRRARTEAWDVPGCPSQRSAEQVRVWAGVDVLPAVLCSWRQQSAVLPLAHSPPAPQH